MKTVALVMVLAGFGCVADGTDGANGAAGSDGKPAALRVDEEAPGSHCPYGGSAIRSGVDDDGDGVLQDDEIDTTAYLCNASDGRPTGIVEGTITIQSSIDTYHLANVTEITGALTVNAPGLKTLSLPKLEKVGGALQLSVPDVTALDLSALTSVGALSIYAPVLDSLASLSSLTTITTSLDISGCTALHSLAGLENLDTLQAVSVNWSGVTSLAPLAGVTSAADVSVYGNSALTTIGAFNVQTTMGSISIGQNPELATLGAFAEVTNAEWFGVYGDNKLGTLSLPKLEALAGFYTSEAAGLHTIELAALETVEVIFQLYYTTELTTVSAPQLTSMGRLYVHNNQSLTTLDLSSLTSITQSQYGAEIMDNPSYRTCLADALRNQLVNFSGPFLVSNGSSASCN